MVHLVSNCIHLTRCPNKLERFIFPNQINILILNTLFGNVTPVVTAWVKTQLAVYSQLWAKWMPELVISCTTLGARLHCAKDPGYIYSAYPLPVATSVWMVKNITCVCLATLRNCKTSNAVGVILAKSNTSAVIYIGKRKNLISRNISSWQYPIRFITSSFDTE